MGETRRTRTPTRRSGQLRGWRDTRALAWGLVTLQLMLTPPAMGQSPRTKLLQPLFERLQQDLAALGLTVLGINFREGTQCIEQYGRDLGLTFPLVLDPQGDIARAYGVIGLPTTFLGGRDGRPVTLAIGARAWGSAEAQALIQALLAEAMVK